MNGLQKLIVDTKDAPSSHTLQQEKEQLEKIIHSLKNQLNQQRPAYAQAVKQHHLAESGLGTETKKNSNVIARWDSDQAKLKGLE